MTVRVFVWALSISIGAFAFLTAPVRAQDALRPADVPDWYVRGVAAALVDPTPGLLPKLLLFPKIFDALAVIGTRDSTIGKPVVDALARVATNEDAKDQEAAVRALGAINPRDPELRNEAVGLLIASINSHDPQVSEAAAETLPEMAKTNPALRKIAIKTFLSLAESPKPVDQFAALDEIAKLGPFDAEQRTSMLPVIQRLADTGNEDVKIGANEALAAVGQVDPANVPALMKLVQSDALTDQLSAAESLGKVEWVDAVQRKYAVDALLALLKNPNLDVQQAAATSLGNIIRDYPDERKSAVEVVLEIVTSDNDLVQGSAAAALEQLNPDDPAQRQAAIEALVPLVTSSENFVRDPAVAALVTLNPTDPGQRRSAVAAILKFMEICDLLELKSAVDDLAKIVPRDADQILSVVAVLLKLADNTEETDVQKSAVDALKVISPVDQDQQKAYVNLLLKLALSDEILGPQANAAAALGIVKPTDEEQRVARFSALLKLSTNSEDDVRNSAVASLSAVTDSEPALRALAVSALLSLAGSNDDDTQKRAIHALAVVYPNDTEQRKVVVDTLLKIAAQGGWTVQGPAAAALGPVNRTDSYNRNAVFDILVKLAASPIDFDVQDSLEALFSFAPLSADDVTRLLAKIGQDGAPSTPLLRAIGWIFNGAMPMENDGAILLTFAGRPGPIAVQHWPKTPDFAGPILTAFARHWALTEGSDALRSEIARQTDTITNEVCPRGNVARSSGRLEDAIDRVDREWIGTAVWIRSWFGEPVRECWQGETLKSITLLRDEFGKAKLNAEHDMLERNIAADKENPVFGKTVLTATGWVFLWVGFVVIFPYSARVRSAYLYNEKARGWLSFGALPLIMLIAPPLRRRMLLPFRDALLADAHLGLLKETEFYPGLRVRDREGQVLRIAAAIPDVRGKLMLIGEFGLGKSTYLRALASRSQSTIAYLNARSCDRGVQTAIAERASGFESPDFFKGLIYSGDLAVIIDGLNEVSADVRAQIITFANTSGRANLIIATQPIEGIGGDRSPFALTTTYELLPLARGDIEAFLKSRPVRDNPNSTVKGEAYDRAVDALLSTALELNTDER